MKKLHLFLLGLVFGAIPTALAAGIAFSDISEDAWYYDSVSSLYDRGIVQGYPDNTYRPANDINRAEMAVILEREINFNAAYDLSLSMVVWSNNQGPAQEIIVNGTQIIGSAANGGGYSDARIREDNIPALAEMLEGKSFQDISFCQQALETELWTIDHACGFLGEISLSDTEFGEY